MSVNTKRQQKQNRTRMGRLWSRLAANGTCTVHCVACCPVLDIREYCSGTFWLKIKQFIKKKIIPFSLGCPGNGKESQNCTTVTTAC